MKLQTSILFLISLVALPLASFAAVGFGGTAIPGGAQTTSFVITKSGAYYLAGDRSMTADVSGIVVNVPDVTIDLNGCTLSFTGGSAAHGIHIPAASNVEIRNGSISDAPGNGIYSTGGSGLRVIDVRVTTAGKNGLHSTTSLTTVDRSSFTYCAARGVSLPTGVSSRVLNSTAAYNGQAGIHLLMVVNGEVSRCNAVFNQLSGIYVDDVGATVTDNTASNNNIAKWTLEGGICVRGKAVVRNNTLVANRMNGIVASGTGNLIESNHIATTYNAAGAVTGNPVYLTLSASGMWTRNTITPAVAPFVSGGSTLVNGGGNMSFN